MLFYTHSSDYAAGSRHGIANAYFKTMHTALLEKGFCVVSVNYKLWIKEGKTTMRDCVKDSKDAIRYLHKHSETLKIDTKNIWH